MTITHAKENDRRRAFVKLFRLASLVVALGGSLNAVTAHTTCARQADQSQARQSYVEQRERQTDFFIIGQERTGLRQKAPGLAQAGELVEIVESVLNNKPAANATTPDGK